VRNLAAIVALAARAGRERWLWAACVACAMAALMWEMRGER
jgi:hypothetical protein